MTVLVFNILFFVGVLEQGNKKIFSLPLIRSYMLPKKLQNIPVQTKIEAFISEKVSFLIILQVGALFYFCSYRRRFEIDLPSILTSSDILKSLKREVKLRFDENVGENVASAQTCHLRGNHNAISMIISTIPINFLVGYIEISSHSDVMFLTDVLVKSALIAIVILDYATEIDSNLKQRNYVVQKGLNFFVDTFFVKA